MIGAVKVRGSVDVDRKIKQTLQHISLDKKNKVVILEENSSNEGMLKKAKDYITYGEISEETLQRLEERNGADLENGDTVTLSPPTGGYKDTKKNVSQGGSLGKRQNMDELINKMV